MERIGPSTSTQNTTTHTRQPNLQPQAQQWRPLAAPLPAGPCPPSGSIILLLIAVGANLLQAAIVSYYSFSIHFFITVKGSLSRRLYPSNYASWLRTRSVRSDSGGQSMKEFGSVRLSLSPLSLWDHGPSFWTQSVFVCIAFLQYGAARKMYSSSVVVGSSSALGGWWKMPLSGKLNSSAQHFWSLGTCVKGVLGTKELCSFTEGTSAESRDHQGPVQRGCLQDGLGGYNLQREQGTVRKGVGYCKSHHFNGGSESTVHLRFY